MNHDTFFNLGLDLDDKTIPCIRTASGTDMGAIGFTTLTFAINKYIFYPTGYCMQKPDKTPHPRAEFLCSSLYRLCLDFLWY